MNDRAIVNSLHFQLKTSDYAAWQVSDRESMIFESLKLVIYTLKNIFALELRTHALKLFNLPLALDQADILLLYLQPIIPIIESVNPVISLSFPIFHYLL